MGADGKLASDALGKAELLISQFSSVFSSFSLAQSAAQVLRKCPNVYKTSTTTTPPPPISPPTSLCQN